MQKCHYFLLSFCPALHQTIKIFCSCIGLAQISAKDSKAYQGITGGVFFQICLINGTAIHSLNKMFENFND